MNLDFIFNLLPQPAFIIFISTFAGAFIREFERQINVSKNKTFLKFLSKFLVSWFISAATILIAISFFDISSNGNLLIGISIIFGYKGPTDCLEFVKTILDKKFTD